jgi:hypothetical protein
MWKAIAPTVVLLLSASGSSGPVIGKPAPAFTAVDIRGRSHSLDAYRGKWVVLEWFNHSCPYTAKHYNSGNMQRLQRTYTERDVIWLSIISSAPGAEGYTTDAQASALAASKRAGPTAIIRDPQGAIGHLYEATNTPNMFVVDPRGILVYAGAIDDKRTSDTADVKSAHNYVRAALDAGISNQPIAVPLTKPYGCIIPYSTTER